jgi:hypothetical protein
VVKICLRGQCKNSTHSNQLRTGSLRGSVELDHNAPLSCRLYDIQIFVPTEFADLLEVRLAVTITLEQGVS